MKTRPALPLSRAVLGALLLGIGLQAAAAPKYDIVDLGILNPNDSFSLGEGVSNGGVAVGISYGDSNQAFSWTAADGTVALGTVSGRTHFTAEAANDNGIVVGRGTLDNDFDDPFPIRWTDGTAEVLPLLQGASAGQAFGVNAGGIAVGTVGNNIGGEAAVYWQGNQVFEITVTTAGGAFMTTAYDINDAGIIVGTGFDPNDRFRNVGLRYDMSTQTLTEIPPGSGGNGTLVFGVSESGFVVGSSGFDQGDGTPFVWSESNGTHLIPLPVGTNQGVAYDVNSNGWVVGNASDIYSIPFLFDGATTHRLQDLIDPAAGWDLFTNNAASAHGIGEDGVIVGTGVYNGQIRAYAMTPADVPVPATLWLLLGGLGAVAGLKRRHASTQGR